MVTATQAQELSKFIARSLSSKGVKQSEILELMAQFEGYKDWNTFKAVDGDSKFIKNSEDWTKPIYVHICNGGFFYSYNKKKSLLKVENSFYGYNNDIIQIKMTKKELQKMLHALDEYLEEMKKEESDYIDYNGNCSFRKEGNGWAIEGYALIFFKDAALMELCHISEKDVAALKNIYDEISMKEN